MGLKEDLESAFQDTLDNKLESNDLAKAITAAYEKSAKKAKDINNNTYSPITFLPLETAIIAAFDLCFALGKAGTPVPLDLNLVSASLVAVWPLATIKMPAKPPPPMTSVTTGLTLVPGFPLPVPPIPDPDPDDPTIDEIVNAFLTMFEKHAKTLTFNLIGFGPPTPAGVPVPIPAFPVLGGLTLK